MFLKFRYTCIREKIANYNKKCPIVFEENEDVTFAVDENSDVESKEDPPVELDESFYRKKWKPSKNGQGKRHKKIIVFGIVQRKGTKCVMKVVDNTQKGTRFPSSNSMCLSRRTFSTMDMLRIRIFRKSGTTILQSTTLSNSWLPTVHT